jgi:hypothetical protein
VLAFVLGSGAATVHPTTRLMASADEGTGPAPQAQHPTLKTAAAKAPDIPFDSDELQTEAQLLALPTNHVAKLERLLNPRRRIPVRPAPMLWPCLKLASFRINFGRALSLRVCQSRHDRLQLDQEGENVALDYDAQHGHEHLMLSPPHRANLLNSAYNVVGLGVVRSGDRLYIVQDFGHALPNYSPIEVKDRIAAAVNEKRRHSGRPELQRRDLLTADDAACSMAQADKLGTTPVRKLAERFTVLTYTSLRPETLPSGATRAISSHHLHSFSIGACYARTDTYPTGVYWVVLSLE